jgi:hypothetical protein
MRRRRDRRGGKRRARSSVEAPAWADLAPPERFVRVAMLLLLAGYVTGVLAVGLALVHRVWDGPTLAHVVVDVAVLLLATVALVLREGPSSFAPARLFLTDPLLPHQMAVLLAFATLPWLLTAGLLGADLSTRPELYSQLVQVIPVLLLAVVLERRFFDAAPRSYRAEADERFVLRTGFTILVLGPILAEIAGLVAVASHVRWVEVVATLLAGVTVPALLVLITTPVLAALYVEAADRTGARGDAPGPS